MRDDRWTERDPLTRLWRLRRGGGRLHPPGSRTVLSNVDRQPRGVCLLQYTVTGELGLQRPGGERRCPPGFAALMWFGENSAYGPFPGESRYESRWLNLDGPGLLEAWSDLIVRSGGVLGPDRDGGLRRAIDALIACRPPRDATERLAQAAAVQRLVLDLYALTIGQRHGVERALEALTADPCACGTLAAVARRHGCSREHLARRFAAVHGQAPHRYLAERRLARARELLTETRLTVAEVALRCGWRSARGLARALGQAPSSARGHPGRRLHSGRSS